MVRRRRAAGEGGLSFDIHAKRWVGRVDFGLRPDGTRARGKVTARTKTQAKAKLDVLLEQRAAGLPLELRDATFGELAALWLKRGLHAEVTDSTRGNYESVIRRHLFPMLEQMRAVDVRPDHFDAILDAMAEAGYSGSTLRHTLNLATRILRLGERRGLLQRNAAAVVEAPRGPVAERHSLTVEQAQALLQVAAADRLGPLITVSLLLGLRPGEAAGLTWPAVQLDTDPPTISIRASLRRTDQGLILAPPKTPTSRRTLALPPAAVDALRVQRQRQDADRAAIGTRWTNPYDLVFTTEVGTPEDPSNVRRTLSRLAHQADIGHIHPHLLRHSAASLLSAAGVSLEDISDTLGHRSVAVTAEIYRHPLAPVRTGHLAAMNALQQHQPGRSAER